MLCSCNGAIEKSTGDLKQANADSGALPNAILLFVRAARLLRNTRARRSAAAAYTPPRRPRFEVGARPATFGWNTVRGNAIINNMQAPSQAPPLWTRLPHGLVFR